MKPLSSALQSRIAKRAAGITELETWKAYHKAQQQMKDYRQMKEGLAVMANDQQLDKQLLKVVREMEQTFLVLPEWWVL